MKKIAACAGVVRATGSFGYYISNHAACAAVSLLHGCLMLVASKIFLF
ncbi:hypothetical protein [Polaromonas sp.]